MKLLAYLPSPVIVALLACSSSTPPISVQLPSSLKIASITVAGSDAANTWTPENSGVSLTLSCNNAPLIVKTDPETIDSAIDGFTLAVPGNCGGLVSCGWIVLLVDPGTPAEIDLATWEPGIRPSITVDGVIQPGEHVFALELHDASDNVLHDPNGNTFWDEVTVSLVSSPDCPPASTGDAG